MKLPHISCGVGDPRINGRRNLVDVLRARGVKVEFAEPAGGHKEWTLRRHLLADSAARLFR